MISIITPWRDHSELIAGYEAAVNDDFTAQVIIVDNASQPANARLLQAMVHRLDGSYIRNERNEYFTHANEQGRAVATGEVLLFLNNDVVASPGWLAQVRRDTCERTLVGPSMGLRVVDGQPLVYLEGWCLAGRRATWDLLGGWDDQRYVLPYWDDNAVCLQAILKGVRLLRRAWPVQHLGGTTTRNTPEAQQAIAGNWPIFQSQVRAARQGAP